MAVHAPKQVCRKRKSTTTVRRKCAKKTIPFSEQTGSLLFSLLNKDCRLEIYEAMLALNESYKCSAQVLTACKKLNEEATGFLYGGNNTFHVAVGEHNVLVNGGSIGSANDASVESAKPLAWPNYLLKCRRLRVERVPYEEGPYVVDDQYAHWPADKTGPELHEAGTIVDLYPIRLIRTPHLKIIAEAVIDPFRWRSSPAELPHVADMTPDMAADRVIQAMNSLWTPLAEMWFDPFVIPNDMWYNLVCVVDNYPIFGPMSGPYDLPGWATLDLMHDIFTVAFDLNVLEDQAGEPDDDPREQICAIRHAYIDLQFACQKTGDDADKLLENRFHDEDYRFHVEESDESMLEFEDREEWED